MALHLDSADDMATVDCIPEKHINVITDHDIDRLSVISLTNSVSLDIVSSSSSRGEVMCLDGA